MLNFDDSDEYYDYYVLDGILMCYDCRRYNNRETKLIIRKSVKHLYWCPKCKAY